MPSLFDSQFWQDIEAMIWDDLDENIIDTLLAGIENGTLMLPANARVLVNFDYINDSVIDFAQRYRYEWIHGITDTTRQQVQKLVSGWVSSGEPLRSLETQLAPLFGDNRARRIAQTESNRVYSEGNREAWESTGVVEMWEWRTTNQDVCPICLELNGQHFGIGDIDALPPDGSHPGCRCFPVPIVSEEAFERRLDEILA